MCRHLPADIAALLAVSCQQFHALLGGNMAAVIMGAGLFHQMQIALQLLPLTFAGDADPVTVVGLIARMHAGIRFAIAHVLGVSDDHRSQLMALAHRLPHDVLLLHADPVIAERMDAHGSERRHVDDFLSLFAHGDRRVRDHMHMRIGFDLLQIRLHRLDIVRIRDDIGHRHDRRKAAGSRRHRSGIDRLFVFIARLAQMHVHIDEPRQQRMPLAVDHFRVRFIDHIRNAQDLLLIKQNFLFHQLLVFQQADVLQKFHHCPPSNSAPKARLITALRTSTPLLICLKMRLFSASTRSLSISTLRLTGAGCKMIACDFIRAARSLVSPYCCR